MLKIKQIESDVKTTKPSVFNDSKKSIGYKYGNMQAKLTTGIACLSI